MAGVADKGSMKTFVLFAILFTSISHAGRAVIKRDGQGNEYHITRMSNGTVIVKGYNMRKGTSWSQTTRPDGSYFGQDAKGNFYQGNKNMYHNSNGKFCQNGYCY